MTSPEVTVRPVQRREVGVVADLHRRAFPAYPSTRLGAGYCRRLIGAYADRADSWVEVAAGADGGIVGYLVAAPPATQRAVDRSLLPWAVLNAWREPADLARNLRRGARRVAGALDRRSASEPTTGTTATGPVAAAPEATVRVVLVAVDVAARGTGAADALLGAFAETARGRGHRTADLSVAAENRAAHRAYERNGWTADATGTHFRRELSPGNP